MAPYSRRILVSATTTNFPQLSAGNNIDGCRAMTEGQLQPVTQLLQAGKVIGRGGETVREIMQRTGAEIKVRLKRICEDIHSLSATRFR
eukprot:2895698-Amphidinium_carterae.1